jgi:hypothetical protein
MSTLPEMFSLDSYPPCRVMATAPSADNGWSSIYGAIDTAANYARLECSSGSFRHVWQHGVFLPFEIHYPGMGFVCSDDPSRMMLCARLDEEMVLREKGYDSAAIGAPFVYVGGVVQSRMRKSLLIVPTHTLTGQTMADRSAFEKYADEISEASRRFDCVVVCLHAGCLKNGFWVREFTDRGIRVICGADPIDANSLQRVKALFSTFECVTTNGWGSHVAYALACGAKVSVFGSRPGTDVEELARIDTSFHANRDHLDMLFSERHFEMTREFLREFYGHPEDGRRNVDLGRYLIGSEHKLSPREMKSLLRDACELTFRGRAAILGRKLAWRYRRLLKTAGLR